MGNAEKIPSGESPDIALSKIPLNLEGEMDSEIYSGQVIVAPQITPPDIDLVATQAGVSEQEAETALKRTNGNIAQAIIDLRSNQ